MPGKHQPMGVMKGRIKRRLGEWFAYLGETEDAEIADAVGLSRERIRQYRKILDIPKFRKPLDLEASRILEAWNAGQSAGWVAETLGISINRVSLCVLAARRRGMDVRLAGRATTFRLPGKRPWRWTKDLIEEAERWWAEGVGRAELARRLHLTVGSLSPWLSKQRKAGHNFPSRRSPSRVVGEPRDLQIVEMWQRGVVVREIAAAVKTNPGQVHIRLCLLRAAGYDVPLRRGPEGPDTVPLWACPCGYRRRGGYDGDRASCPACGRGDRRWWRVGVAPRPRSISKALVGEKYELK